MPESTSADGQFLSRRARREAERAAREARQTEIADQDAVEQPSEATESPEPAELTEPTESNEATETTASAEPADAAEPDDAAESTDTAKSTGFPAESHGVHTAPVHAVRPESDDDLDEDDDEANKFGPVAPRRAVARSNKHGEWPGSTAPRVAGTPAGEDAPEPPPAPAHAPSPAPAGPKDPWKRPRRRRSTWIDGEPQDTAATGPESAESLRPDTETASTEAGSTEAGSTEAGSLETGGDEPAEAPSTMSASELANEPTFSSRAALKRYLREHGLVNPADDAPDDENGTIAADEPGAEDSGAADVAAEDDGAEGPATEESPAEENATGETAAGETAAGETADDVPADEDLIADEAVAAAPEPTEQSDLLTSEPAVQSIPVVTPEDETAGAEDPEAGEPPADPSAPDDPAADAKAPATESKPDRQAPLPPGATRFPASAWATATKTDWRRGQSDKHSAADGSAQDRSRRMPVIKPPATASVSVVTGAMPLSEAGTTGSLRPVNAPLAGRHGGAPKGTDFDDGSELEDPPAPPLRASRAVNSDEPALGHHGPSSTLLIVLAAVIVVALVLVIIGLLVL